MFNHFFLIPHVLIPPRKDRKAFLGLKASIKPVVQVVKSAWGIIWATFFFVGWYSWIPLVSIPFFNMTKFEKKERGKSIFRPIPLSKMGDWQLPPLG